MPVPRGKVVGGTSAINGQVLLRGVPEDYDGWAALGNNEWEFIKVLPYFRKLETGNWKQTPTSETTSTASTVRFPCDATSAKPGCRSKSPSTKHA